MNNAVPEGWKWSTLGDYINIGRGYAFKSEDYESNGVPVVRVTNIESDGRLNLSDNVVFLSTTEAANYSEYELNGNDVLIVMVGATVGKLARVEAKYASALLNQNMWRLVVKSNSDSCQKYAYYAVQPVVDRFLSSQQGSARGFLTQKDFSLAETILPPLPEQQKIATILSSVDDVIEKTQAQIDKLKDLKTGMMQELLTKGIGHTEFKDSPVGRIPVGWVVVRIQDVANVVDSMHKTPSFSDVGMPMVRVTEIRQSEVLDISGAVLVNDETFNVFSKNYQPTSGDILIARVGAYFGATTFISKNHKFCLGQNTASIRPNNIYPLYLFDSLNSPVGKSQMEDAVAVGAQPSLSLKTIKELRVALPPIEEQRIISETINSVRNNIFKVSDKLDSLKKLKKALMEDLLTGKVRVKVDQ